MKKTLLLLVLGFISFSFINEMDKNSTKVLPAGEGIKFEKMTLEEAMTLAKSSGKTIFIDAYTEWCGPCKRMAATSFMDEEVAKTYNGKFINLKIEMEKSADGPTVARTYGVKAYPTLLFIDGTGKLKKSVVGLQSASDLLALAKTL